MQRVLIAFFVLFLSTSVFASEATDLRYKGVQAAANGDFVSAQKFLSKSAKLGFYTAQVEYAFLLESSPGEVQNSVESYAWYQVVIARKGTDTEFAEEGVLRLNSQLSGAELQEAKELAAQYVALYAK